jgi:23S rRNA (cytosine1962-C5)-methyltransferase
MRTLHLKKGEDRRLRAGHLWVFSNEIDVKCTPLTDLEPGEPVRVHAASGRPLGCGYANPASLISVRLCSADPAEAPGPDWLRSRLYDALALREHFWPETPFYRLCYAEGDFLPGLTVDRYGDHLAVQATTAGMERMLDDAVQVLDDLLAPASILLKNDAAVRGLEGLEEYVRPAKGAPPERIALEENGLRYCAPLAAGQKTGWFYDQRDNRRAFAAACPEGRVLDAFCYAGGFGLAAAARQGREALCLDASASALACVRESAAENGLDQRVETRQGEAFQTMEALVAAGETFAAVCVDPPAFIPRRKDKKKGAGAYERLNRLALDLLADGGLLMTCSCSQHMPRQELRAVLARAASKAGRRVQVVGQGHQAADHPVHPAMPETDYLKTFLLRVLPA